MRPTFVAGNWKMNTHRASAVALATAVAQAARAHPSVRVAVFPPYPYLALVADAVRDSPLQVGAQDHQPGPDGALTGQVSLAMIRDCGCSIVLAGHSERRHVLGEPDALINAKVRSTLEAGLHCILCVGETLDQRRAGETDGVNERQLTLGLAGVSPSHADRLTIAYEPVWAIGTGVTASRFDAAAAHQFIRRVLDRLVGAEPAGRIRIQYGGSVKKSNAADLFTASEIDGALVGGASLDPTEFEAIVKAAADRSA